MSKASMFIVGARGSGVVFVKTNPLRATIVPHEAIAKYSTKTGKDGYAVIGAAAAKFVAAQDGDPKTNIDDMMEGGIAELLRMGEKTSTADFAFVRTISNEGFDLNRLSCPPILSALQMVSPSSSVDVKGGKLAAAVMES